MKNNNKDKYTLGYVFICRGVATKILVGFSIFKGDEGVITVFDDDMFKKTLKFIGVNNKFAQKFIKRDFHNLGSGEWNNMRKYMNGLTQLGDLKPIALKGNETEEDYRKILKGLV